MSLADTINSLDIHLSESYEAIEEMGGELPGRKNFENLAEAIESIG